LDAASKTAEGFKTSATSGDAKASEDRVRDPRAFYGKERYFKIYNETDSELLKYLTAEKRDYSLYAAYEVFETETDPNDCYILGLCYESLVYYSLKKNRFIRDIDMKNIAKVNNFNDGIQIHLKNPIPDCKVFIFIINNFLRIKSWY
jgi:vacuolar protein sorting-associated protein 13A/C